MRARCSSFTWILEGVSSSLKSSRMVRPMLSLSLSCEVGRSAGGDGGNFGRGRPGEVWSGRQSIVMRDNVRSRQKV